MRVNVSVERNLPKAPLKIDAAANIVKLRFCDTIKLVVRAERRYAGSNGSIMTVIRG